MGDAMYHGKQARDDEGSRTVTLTAKDVREAARLLAIIAPEMKQPAVEQLLKVEGPDYSDLSEGEPSETFEFIDLARTAFRERRRRSKFFDGKLFGEPGWDMLLALYINHFSGERMTVSRVLRFAGAPYTTSLRWLTYLEEAGLAVRQNHPLDARCVLIHLSDDARRALNMYFSETLKSGT